MSLQSMTGFARAGTEVAGATVGWELRSLNGKGLDVRFRLPPGLERIEQPARQMLQKRFSRGSVQAVLSISGRVSPAQPVVNEAFLTDVAGLARRLEERFGVAPASADGLLALRGVLEIPDAGEDEEGRSALDSAILSALDEALGELERARRGEGTAIAQLLADHLDAMDVLAARIEADPSRDPARIRERLAEQVRLLIDAGAAMDEARLHQEAAFLAAKADIREEIDRLKTHVVAGRALLRGEGPVGRKLDFLAQEFSREANTLCAKSNAASVTAIGLELKSVVDQFREQIQNME